MSGSDFTTFPFVIFCVYLHQVGFSSPVTSEQKRRPPIPQARPKHRHHVQKFALEFARL